ncbi:glycosyltransferase [Streptomyces sp. NPDC005761]|uniref:glycosyltransferase n=1 Tax=unclassified Streptomyces TaxID=2593676 RepID=UPI0033E5C66E
MRSRLLTAATLATALSAVGLLATAQSAVAAPQSCDYKVVWPTAGVYENPNPNSVIVKTKQAGDIVGAPGPGCEYAGWNDITYARVNTDAAADGVGWMRYEALVRV